MDSLFEFLSTPTSYLNFLMFLIVCFIGYILVRRGWVGVHTEKLTIGRDAAEKEQVILRRQIEYIDLTVNACMRGIPKHEKWDEWRTRFVFEKVIDEMVNWCAFNHIDTSQRYISLKQEAVWSIVQKYTWHEVYQSDEFREYVDEVVSRCVKNLVEIRKEYSR